MSRTAATTARGTEYIKWRVSDGIEQAMVNIWNAALGDTDALDVDNGVIIRVQWHKNYRSFVLTSDAIRPLERKVGSDATAR
jgi:hypothetical protein